MRLRWLHAVKGELEEMMKTQRMNFNDADVFCIKHACDNTLKAVAKLHTRARAITTCPETDIAGKMKVFMENALKLCADVNESALKLNAMASGFHVWPLSELSMDHAAALPTSEDKNFTSLQELFTTFEEERLLDECIADDTFFVDDLGTNGSLIADQLTCVDVSSVRTTFEQVKESCTRALGIKNDFSRHMHIIAIIQHAVFHQLNSYEKLITCLRDEMIGKSSNDSCGFKDDISVLKDILVLIESVSKDFVLAVLQLPRVHVKDKFIAINPIMDVEDVFITLAHLIVWFVSILHLQNADIWSLLNSVSKPECSSSSHKSFSFLEEYWDRVRFTTPNKAKTWHASKTIVDKFCSFGSTSDYGYSSHMYRTYFAKQSSWLCLIEAIFKSEDFAKQKFNTKCKTWKEHASAKFLCGKCGDDRDIPDIVKTRYRDVFLFRNMSLYLSVLTQVNQVRFKIDPQKLGLDNHIELYSIDEKGYHICVNFLKEADEWKSMKDTLLQYENGPHVGGVTYVTSFQMSRQSRMDELSTAARQMETFYERAPELAGLLALKYFAEDQRILDLSDTVTSELFVNIFFQMGPWGNTPSSITTE